MNTLGKQLEGIIEKNLQKTMNIKIPINVDDINNDNLLMKVYLEQQEQRKQLSYIRFMIDQLRSDIQKIVHHHEYNC